MSQPIDGGSAFPVHSTHVVFNDRVVAAHEPGMSLRDWLAGQALTGLLADPNNNGRWNDIAVEAYGFADAMLARRKGGRL